MKKIIRLTESDLHRIVKRSVKRILEAHGQGLSYNTVRSAYNKMRGLGQYSRADRLAQTYADVNNDEDAYYDMDMDTMSIPSETSGGYIDYKGHGTNGDSRNLSSKASGYSEIPLQDPENTEGGMNPRFINRASKVDSAARAKRRANHMNNFYWYLYFYLYSLH